MNYRLSLYETQMAKKIKEVCSRLHQRNMLAAADGNVSVRLDDQRILITPTAVNKGFFDWRQMCVITLDNRILRGSPSSERLMHLEVYSKNKIAKAVVHAHPPTAIAFSLAKDGTDEIPANALSEVVLAVGRVPIASYARPGTPEMGTVLHSLVEQHRVIILARHGALSWGEDLAEAYNGMERVEHICQILQTGLTLGELNPLPEEELAALKKMRARLGAKTL